MDQLDEYAGTYYGPEHRAIHHDPDHDLTLFFWCKHHGFWRAPALITCRCWTEPDTRRARQIPPGEPVEGLS